VEDAILKHLERVGCASVYELVKAFDTTYGRMQWYLFKLTKMGAVKTVKIGRHRYILCNGCDLSKCVKIGDLLEELRARLSLYGVSESAPLKEAERVLRSRLPEAYDLFMRLLDGR
jgi:DNA-binding transcriptional ArsR family regulator